VATYRDRDGSSGEGSGGGHTNGANTGSGSGGSSDGVRSAATQALSEPSPALQPPANSRDSANSRSAAIAVEPSLPVVDPAEAARQQRFADLLSSFDSRSGSSGAGAGGSSSVHRSTYGSGSAVAPAQPSRVSTGGKDNSHLPSSLTSLPPAPGVQSALYTGSVGASGHATPSALTRGVAFGATPIRPHAVP
jgi:hypothetical protein